MTDRGFDPERVGTLTEGAVWERRKGNHEGAIEILRRVTGSIGTRYLVQGLESRRQWLVGHSTLLATYRPRTDAPPL